MITRPQSVSANAAIATISAPTVGDLIVVFAYNGANTTIPSLPAGYSSLYGQGGQTQAARIGQKISDGTEVNTGTWTNATQVVCFVYRGAQALSNSSLQVSLGNSAIISYPALDITDSGGNSWVLGCAGAKAASAGMNASTALLTNRTNQTTANGLDSGAGVTAYAGELLTVTGSGRWIGFTIEVPIAAGAHTTEIYGQPVDDPACDLHQSVYAPNSGTFGPGPYPACLLIHQGHFRSGSPDSDSNQVIAAQDMAAAGYLAANIEFRQLNPIAGQTTTGQFPQAAIDCKMAIAHMLADPRCNGKIVVIGGSSGATQAAMMCLSWNTGALPLGAACLSPPTKFSERSDTQIDFINAVQGYTNTIDDAPGLATQLADSPVSFVGPNTKPIYLVFSDNENMPLSQRNAMANALSGAGVQYFSVTFSGTNHAFANWAAAKNLIIQFFNNLIAADSAQGTPRNHRTGWPHKISSTDIVDLPRTNPHGNMGKVLPYTEEI